jgi:hypothetical protein
VSAALACALLLGLQVSEFGTEHAECDEAICLTHSGSSETDPDILEDRFFSWPSDVSRGFTKKILLCIATDLTQRFLPIRAPPTSKKWIIQT